MNFIPIIIYEQYLIVAGVVALIFPKFIWLHDVGANNTKRKVDVLKEKIRIYRLLLDCFRPLNVCWQSIYPEVML